MSVIIEGKYKVIKKLGEGSFGKIFSCINNNTNEEVAIKIEEDNKTSVLKNEARMYTALRELDGIPNMRAWGKEGKFNYLVIDHLGKSLEDLKISYSGKLTLKTVLLMGIQMIEIIEEVHRLGILHRDIKPDNFLIGNGCNKNTLYLIDFGLAKVYIKKGKHVKQENNRNLTGTARYVSINIHNGILPSRRDDIESIGYILLYLLNGELPWQGLKSNTREEKQKLIGNVKREIKLWDIYSDFIPGEIFLFINYCRKLRFEEIPDYQYLKDILNNLYKHKKYKYDNKYELVHQ
jgi:serine/threonine protein kinase